MKDNNFLRLAKILYSMFDMRFSRKWEDLPENVQEEYLDDAKVLVERWNYED